MRKIFSVLLLVAVLCGCSTNEVSYQGILIINEDRYILGGYDESNEYTIDKTIGTVANSVKPNVMPSGHLWANCLDKGTQLFNSGEDDSVVLAESNGRIEIFRKEISK